MKVRIAVLREKLEAAKTKNEADILKYVEETDKDLQRFKKEAVEYLKKQIKRVESFKDSADYFKRTQYQPHPGWLETGPYTVTDKAFNARAAIRDIDRLLKKLDLAAGDTINVTDNDNYFHYIK